MTLNTTISNNTMELSGDGLDVTVNNGVATIAIPNATVSVNNQISSIYQPEMSNEWFDITNYLSSSDEDLGSLINNIWTFPIAFIGDELRLSVTDDVLLNKRPTKMRFRGCNGAFNTDIGFQAKTAEDSIIFDVSGGRGLTQLCDSFPSNYLTILQDPIEWPEGLGDISYFLVYLDLTVAWKATKIEVFIP